MAKSPGKFLEAAYFDLYFTFFNCVEELLFAPAEKIVFTLSFQMMTLSLAACASLESGTSSRYSFMWKMAVS